MYEEGLDIVRRAWTEETITADGEFWQIPQPVEVLPKPYQRPHPPIYQACISPESFSSAARSGVDLQLASPFTYRTYREAWVDKLAENLGLYEAECEKLGRDPKAVERMMLLPFFVAETDDQAQAIYRERVEWFYAKVTANQKSTPGQATVVSGYELTMSESRKTLAGGYLAFDKLLRYDAAIAGSPDTCVDRLTMLRERLGITEFVLWYNIGGMPLEHSLAAMKLMKSEVAPRVEATEEAREA